MVDNLEEYKKQGRLTSFLSRLSVFHVILFGILIFILIAINKNSTGNSKYNYVIFGVLIVIIIVLWNRPDPNKKLIPEYIIKQIAQEAVNKKVREGKEFAFDSKVYIKPACQVKWETDLVTGTSGPVSWEVGFVEKVHGSQFEKEGVISLHPFEGTITGIRFLPFGYSGVETKDVKIVPVGVVQGSMKTTDFGGNPVK